MVHRQIAARGVSAPRVLAAMRQVPREAFLSDSLREFAYDDTPLPIEEGQTISQPYIVARMAEAAEIGPADRVLEIGSGSGYAAAVLGELAAEVFTVERHEALASLARHRLGALGYANVEVRTGDGTLGWPQKAPFDAIIATAGGPRIPQALRDQLAVGGRLVMPVGDAETRQHLLRLTRRDSDEWLQETLEVVRFVPLIGAEGWPDPEADNAGPEAATGPSLGPAAVARGPLLLPDMIRNAAQVLPAFDDSEFAAGLDRYADRRVVLLGEASHGTSEFYRARAAITQRLVERHGFHFVAVEADWPDGMAIDRYVRHRTVRETSAGAAPAFRRFPTWMWRNTDVAVFVEWLRACNATHHASDRVGFYGLDIYGLSESISSVLAYLDNVDPDAARAARERYGCLTPFQHDPAVYGRAVLTKRYRDCEKDVIAVLKDLLAKRLAYARVDGQQFFEARQNAELAAAAERYYRAMYYGAAESWNLRDRHMFRTLENLLAHRGPDSKAVVWAHNSHVGDARFTDMGRHRGELNLGELCRRRFGNQVALIGMGTHAGTVAAASDWDGPMEIKQVRPSRDDSVERRFHEAGHARSLVHLRPETPLSHALAGPFLERFIGVIYRPESELASHYAGAELPRQFDTYLWFDTTSAVTPLSAEPQSDTPAALVETWPFGV